MPTDPNQKRTTPTPAQKRADVARQSDAREQASRGVADRVQRLQQSEHASARRGVRK